MARLHVRAHDRFWSHDRHGRRSRPSARRALTIGLVAVAMMLGGLVEPLVNPAFAALGAPTISANAPAQGTIGTQLVITGTNLKRGTTKPIVKVTKAGSTNASKLVVTSVTPTQITATVTSALKPGSYDVSVKWGTKYKLNAPTPLSIEPPSSLTVAPEVGPLGSSVTVQAGFLGAPKGTVLVGTKQATISSWLGTTDSSAGTIVFKVPTGLANGYHDLVVSNAIGSSSADNGLIVVGQPDTSGIELRLSNAAATSNTEILVQFSKPVDPRKAELPDHYRITALQGAATVKVVGAQVERPSLTTVRLTTLPQSEISYTLKVTDIVDLAGHPLAAPSGTLPSDPSSTTFRGIGAGVTGQGDTDGDGVTDADEQRGYSIVIRHTDGSTETRSVTSDPFDADSDNDLVTDDQEKHAGADPRTPDTDGDTLTDNQEWNLLLSNPADQDTDRDGIQDGYEYCCLGTSPLLDDTDGDQISDGDEIFTRNRNPLVADLPAEMISVGNVRLQLDQRFTYVDEAGHRISTTDSAQSTLQTNTSSTYASGENLTLGGSLWLEAGLRDGTGGYDGFFRAHGEFNVSHTSQWSSESVQQTQKAYQQSLEKGNELSTTSSVAREVVGASISADVTIQNRGNVAFSLGGLEVTVSERSPESSFQLVPVATLIANAALTTGNDVTFHLGPFNSTRGPVVFASRDVFPNLVEKLMKDPSSLVFTIANFDMTDELSRHFTYSEQIARDRTGGILIDSGDGNVKRNLVATSLQADPDHISGGDYVGGFNTNGSPIGIPLDFALQHILGMTKNATTPDGIVSTDQTVSSRAIGDDVQLIPRGTTGVPIGSVIISAGANHVLDSTAAGNDEATVTTGYETQDIDGIQTLVRVGGQRNGDFSRQWFVGTTEDTPAGADFGTLMLKPGEDFYLVFVQDLDQDGLFARTEALAGSTDSVSDIFDNSKFGLINPARGPSDPYLLLDPVATPDGIADSKDTDRDGLGDFAELRVGWQVSADSAALTQVYSSPRLPDSDGDGLLDPQEQDLRSFCNPSDPRRDALCTFQAGPPVAQHDAIAIIAGPNGTANTLAAGDDVQLVAQGTTGLTYATRLVAPGANGTIDTLLSDDDLYQSTASSRRIPPASNPLLVDTDADRVTDFEELTGYTVGLAVRDGDPPCGSCNGKSETLAIGDDVQQARLNGPAFRGGIVVLPGPNGTIESTPGGDDHLVSGHSVTTDPLRHDTDNDLVGDGRELDIGGDPTNPLDAAEFKDSDRDGLTDSEESILGWMVSVNGAAEYLVLSSPSRPDSDQDGLPDLAERIINTDPNKLDTDGDGLSDFDELDDFGQFRGLEDGNPGFVLDGTTSRQYGSSPNLTDTDADGLTDKQEVTGYRMLVAGESTTRLVITNPTVQDTDLDGVRDGAERNRTVSGVAKPTDATDPDTDDDTRNEGIEQLTGTDPLVKDRSVTVTFGTLYLDRITDVGGAGGAEVSWFYTVVDPAGTRQLVSDASNSWGSTTPYIYGGDGFAYPDCTIAGVDPGYSYTLPLNRTLTMTMLPGQSFKVEGILFELDAASSDCGLPPTYIPSWVRSGCVTRFAQSFYFDDFAAGGRANFPFPTGQGTAENCDWTQEIYVNSR
ncbi:MAG: IPT/TIG domain-containing protein [Candidatus Limnocylindrales bacterium]